MPKPHHGRCAAFDCVAFREFVTEFEISQVTPTRPANDGITKAGLISCRGTQHGREVKIWQCFTEQQAVLRESMNSRSLACEFPEVIQRRGKLLLEEWVPGRELRSLAPTMQANIANRVLLFMQECKRIPTHSWLPDFDYFNYLIDRISSSGIKQVKHLHAHWLSQPLTTEALLSHNDLSLDNIIYDSKTDAAYIVDNEMLGVSRGWFLAWNNSFLPKTNLEPDTFLGPVSSELVIEAWKLRKVGSMLLKNDDRGILNLLESK